MSWLRSENANELVQTLSLGGAIASSVGIALSVFGLYRCPLAGPDGALMPLCSYTIGGLAFSLAILVVSAAATRVGESQARPVAAFFLGLVASLYWLGALEVYVWVRSWLAT